MPYLERCWVGGDAGGQGRAGQPRGHAVDADVFGGVGGGGAEHEAWKWVDGRSG